MKHRHPLPQLFKRGSTFPPKYHGFLKPIEIPPFVPPAWTPPSDYEYIARYYMSDPEPYLERCRQWHADNPPPVQEPKPPKHVINNELIAALYGRHWPRVPPVDELVTTLKAAGVPPDTVDRFEKVRRRNLSTEIQAENQNWIDVMFSKWPSASKPTPKAKPVPKMIKAVKKKKINISDA